MHHRVYRNESHHADEPADAGRPPIAISPALIAYLAAWTLGVLVAQGVIS